MDNLIHVRDWLPRVCAAANEITASCSRCQCRLSSMIHYNQLYIHTDISAGHIDLSFN